MNEMVRVRVLLELLHFLVVPLQSLVLFLECQSALPLAVGQVMDERVLFVVGDTHLRANVDHELTNDLTVIDHESARRAIEYADTEFAELVAVVDCVLQ